MSPLAEQKMTQSFNRGCYGMASAEPLPPIPSSTYKGGQHPHLQQSLHDRKAQTPKNGPKGAGAQGRRPPPASAGDDHRPEIRLFLVKIKRLI
eukprot:scaffold241418_cov38-Prasinocladus_malaysianus.AAC.1